MAEAVSTIVSSYTVMCDVQRQEKRKVEKTFARSPLQNFCCAPLAKLGPMPTSHPMTGMETWGSRSLLRPVLGSSFPQSMWVLGGEGTKLGLCWPGGKGQLL